MTRLYLFFFVLGSLSFGRQSYCKALAGLLQGERLALEAGYLRQAARSMDAAESISIASGDGFNCCALGVLKAKPRHCP
jgi:hypothetical protein